MAKSLSYQARRALLQQTVSQYREALPSQKRSLLDAFVETTGYNRTYAGWLLNHAEEAQKTLVRPHPRKYGPHVQHTLFSNLPSGAYIYAFHSFYMQHAISISALMNEAEQADR